MRNYSIAKPTDQMIDQLAETMNPADVAEINAMGFTLPVAALQESVRVSRDTPRALLTDGYPIAMAGIYPWGSISTTGVPWVLTSQRLAGHGIAFLKCSKIFATGWLKEYNRLFQLVDERHMKARRWIEWLGFRECGRQFLGPDNMPFVGYQMGRQ